MSIKMAVIAEWKVNQIFYECAGGSNMRFCMVKEPEWGVEDGNRTLYWVGVNTETGVEVNFRLTEGWESYGPRIYLQPEYYSNEGWGKDR